MSLTALVFWVTYTAGVCAAVFNPVAGLALYVLVYHLNPETQWWGASVRALELRTSFTVALAAGVGMLVRRVRLEHGAKQFPAPYALAILLGVLSLGSLAWGVDVNDRGQYQAEKYVKLMIILYILVRCVRTPLHYQVVLMAWLVGVLYLGYEAWGGVGSRLGGRLTRGLGGPDFADSSGLAVHLVATLPLIGAAFFMARTWWGRLFALATGAFTVNLLVMTRTRNVLVGLAVIAATTVLHLPRGYRLKGLAAVLAGTLLAVQLADPTWWARMRTITEYRQDAAAIGRITYWKAAIAMAHDYPFGIGLGNFHTTVMEYVPGLTVVRSAHSTVFTCLAELGWPGLFVFLLIVGITIWRLGQLRRVARELPAHTEVQIYHWRTRFHLDWHVSALRAGLLGYLACGMFTTRLFAEDFWLLVGFGMCLHNVSKYMVAEKELEEDAPCGTISGVAQPPAAEAARAEARGSVGAAGPPVSATGKVDHVTP